MVLEALAKAVSSFQPPFARSDSENESMTGTTILNSQLLELLLMKHINAVKRWKKKSLFSEKSLNHTSLFEYI